MIRSTRWLVPFLLSCLWVSSARGVEPPGGIRHYDAGPAPEFTLTDMDGEEYSLAEDRGRWIFLHFWASWCGPCREEMPAIQQLADTIDPERLAIVMVNTAEDADTIFRFTAEIGMQLPSLMDRDGRVTERYRPRGLPATFLLDPQGNIRYQAIGGREWDKSVYIRFLQELTEPGGT